jgi:hypothetical protein|tara:strand:+ start:12478 stop:12927 length:450 start_codon:yes stop_codon:yes gene_type:complete
MKEKTAIDEIIYALNDVFGEDNPEGYSFVYETNGWYECIRFNEHVLWDSEDNQAWLSERPDWEGDYKDDDHDEDILGCIKRRYNDYINQLKGYRFDVKSKKSHNSDAEEAVSEMFEELNGRKGLDMNDFDEDIIDEIYQACVTIVEKHN